MVDGDVRVTLVDSYPSTEGPSHRVIWIQMQRAVNQGFGGGDLTGKIRQRESAGSKHRGIVPSYFQRAPSRADRLECFILGIGNPALTLPLIVTSTDPGDCHSKLLIELHCLSEHPQSIVIGSLGRLIDACEGPEIVIVGLQISGWLSRCPLDFILLDLGSDNTG